MQKLIYASILFATLGLPIWHARERSFDVGLRKMTTQLIGFVVAWAFGCIFAYLRLG